MGVGYASLGDIKSALKSYIEALKISPASGGVYYNLGRALVDVQFTEPSPKIKELILSILEKKTKVRPINIVLAAVSLLKFEPGVKRALDEYSSGTLGQSFGSVIIELSHDPLLLKLMSVCPLNDLEFEFLFKELRLALLSSAFQIPVSLEGLRFLSALALQCFTNEYIYDQSDNEIKALESLESSVVQTFANDEQPSPQLILCLASYKALHEYEWCDLLSITPDIEEVFIQQIVEPKEEARLKSNIPVLKKITDKVSSKVRDQYEARPYPRWVNLGLSFNPSSISRVVNESNLRLSDQRITEVENPNILVAGCGTGQHSISTASRFDNSTVLAVDLSTSSLAYAQRKTNELDIMNTEYMQADILDLGKLGRQFDIVESAGVLHHMDDPMVGWQVLVDCLKPGGLMQIGLYSELARKHVVKIRDEISQSSFDITNKVMKNFRNKIIKSDQEHHKTILYSSDFYSMSSLKDLLFHVQEHRFTLPQIKDCLFELGLEFCGFTSPKILRNFKSGYLDTDDLYDLDKWHSYETSNPSTFVEMYQFWCQKS